MHSQNTSSVFWCCWWMETVWNHEHFQLKIRPNREHL